MKIYKVEIINGMDGWSYFYNNKEQAEEKFKNADYEPHWHEEVIDYHQSYISYKDNELYIVCEIY